MLIKMAKFDVVSDALYSESKNLLSMYDIDVIDYEELTKILPSRSTYDSAGYDFKLPRDLVLEPGESVVIETYMRCKIDKGWYLMVVPRSGLGFKYHVRLANTMGIIDGDYYYADNEGHIMIKLVNDGDKTLELKKGDAFAQGIFCLYGITYDDENYPKKNRKGGLGSTTEQK